MRKRCVVRMLCIAAVLVVIGPLVQVSAGSANDKCVEAVEYNLYFGDLHTHTGYSDSYDEDGTPWDAFAAAKAAGADFMATTDHLAIWNAYNAYVIDEEEWADTLEAADYYTDDEFVAMPGYEAWMLAKCGEINVYNTRDLPEKHPLKDRYDRLPDFFDWLVGKEGAIGQFNHPLYMSDNFMDYDFWSETRDAGMGVIEAYNGEYYEASYILALDAGWHLMPSANSDTHYADWIVGHEMRTVLLAPRLTPDDLYDAMRASRGYATLDKNLEIQYTLNGAVMGSTLSSTGTTYVASVSVMDPDGAADGITLIEIVTDGGAVIAQFQPDNPMTELAVDLEFESDGARYFFLRVTTESPLNGEPGVTAWTAPVWTGR